MVLDCGATPKRKIYLNPMNPFTNPAVGCPNNSAVALRVFYGESCAVWQQNNSLGCSWNAIKQTFEGGGCVSDPTTRCMCGPPWDSSTPSYPR